MTVHFIRATALMGAALLNTLVVGQPLGPLSNEHPIVVEHLIQFHSALAGHVALRNNEDPAHAASRTEGLHRIFGVGPEGYRVLSSVLSDAKIRLDTAKTARSTGSSGTSSITATATLELLYNQQLSILRTVSTDLRKLMTAAEWRSFQDFITREFTTKIEVSPLSIPRRQQTRRIGSGRL